MKDSALQITLQSIEETLARLAPYVVRTPSVPAVGPQITAALGDAVVLKLELLQRTGTFKYRGALNNLLNADLEGRGVTAVSAGNHAVAVACAAAQLGVDAKIVMQASANPARRLLAASYGAEILIEPDGPAAFAHAERLVTEEGRLMVHPFDGPFVTAASGGVGRELLADAGPLDAVIVSVGGGGLIGRRGTCREGNRSELRRVWCRAGGRGWYAAVARRRPGADEPSGVDRCRQPCAAPHHTAHPRTVSELRG